MRQKSAFFVLFVPLLLQSGGKVAFGIAKNGGLLQEFLGRKKKKTFSYSTLVLFDKKYLVQIFFNTASLEV